MKAFARSPTVSTSVFDLSHENNVQSVTVFLHNKAIVSSSFPNLFSEYETRENKILIRIVNIVRETQQDGGFKELRYVGNKVKQFDLDDGFRFNGGPVGACFYILHHQASNKVVAVQVGLEPKSHTWLQSVVKEYDLKPTASGAIEKPTAVHKAPVSHPALNQMNPVVHMSQETGSIYAFGGLAVYDDKAMDEYCAEWKGSKNKLFIYNVEKGTWKPSIEVLPVVKVKEPREKVCLPDNTIIASRFLERSGKEELVIISDTFGYPHESLFMKPVALVSSDKLSFRWMKPQRVSSSLKSVRSYDLSGYHAFVPSKYDPYCLMLISKKTLEIIKLDLLRMEWSKVQLVGAPVLPSSYTAVFSTPIYMNSSCTRFTVIAHSSTYVMDAIVLEFGTAPNAVLQQGMYRCLGLGFGTDVEVSFR